MGDRIIAFILIIPNNRKVLWYWWMYREEHEVVSTFLLVNLQTRVVVMNREK